MICCLCAVLTHVNLPDTKTRMPQAKGNANTVFLYAGAAVAVCCGAVHTAKAIVKAISRKLRIGRLCAAPLVTFVCDGMLPTGFAGPFLASYVTFKVLMHAQQMAEVGSALAIVCKEAPSCFVWGLSPHSPT